MNIVGVINQEEYQIRIDDTFVSTKELMVFIKGKIFNLETLCSQYKKSFDSEEEIIRYLYEHYGTSFVNQLDGDFAIIIYDPKIQKLYLIKDKLGSVFLYYYHKDDTFLFSTSLKSLMNVDGFRKKIDKQVLANYLGYMYIYEPFTIFADTYKVKKGTIVTYQNGKVREDVYFDLAKEYKKIKKLPIENEEHLADEFNQLFKSSIGKRGNKDSKVGIFMSSGKDSTLLAKLASTTFTKKVNTYTLGFENERDETNEAAKIASYIGSSHHPILLKDECVLETIQKMPKIYEEPFADPSIIPSIYMTEHIKENNDFYITGEGNDAIFIASSMYHIYNFVPRVKLCVKKVINQLQHKRVYHGFDEMAQVNILGRFNYSDKIVQQKGKVYPLPKLSDHRMRAVLGDLQNTVSEKYKVKTSSLARYHGYEYYTPFYDPSILLKTFALPIDEIYKEGKGKYIFEKVLYKNIPKKYFENYKKNGFGVPLVDWVQRIMLDDIKRLSTLDKIEKQQLFDYQALQTLIVKFEENPDYNKAVVLWCYYIFELWYNENIESL